MLEFQGFLFGTISAATVMLLVLAWPWCLPSADVMPLVIFAWFAITLITAICAAGPLMLAAHIAVLLRTRSVWYFVVCAAATGLLFDALQALIAWWSGSVGDPERLGFGESYERFLPMYLAGGVTGGFVYWLLVRRQAGEGQA